MRQIVPKLTLLFAAAALLCATALANPHDEPVKRKRNRAGATKVHVDRGSAETTRERERRLSRECKGRSNSGACEGYTR